MGCLQGRSKQDNKRAYLLEVYYENIANSFYGNMDLILSELDVKAISFVLYNGHLDENDEE